MSTYDNTNSGALFVNKRKEKDTHPSHTGKINVEGVDYWLSAWIKEKRDGSGERFFSMSLKRADGQTNATPTPNTGGFEQYDDDIPF